MPSRGISNSTAGLIQNFEEIQIRNSPTGYGKSRRKN
jgi:hypothetical protein